MVLAMIRPTKHPKSGTYVIRMAIPEALQDSAKALFGVRAEFRENLHTKDAAEARLRAPAAEALLRQRLARLRAVPLTPSAAAEIAAKWAAWIAGGAPLDTGGEDSDVFEPLALPDAKTPERLARMWKRVEAHADEALRLAGAETTPGTRALLLRAMLPVVNAAYLQADLVTAGIGGDASITRPLDTVRKSLPAVPEAPSPAAPGVPFSALLSGWAADQGMNPDAKPVPRALYDRQRTLTRLEDFLGQHDAAKVTKADAVRWKEDGQKRGLTAGTLRNDISEMSAIWKWAIRNGKLSENPFEGIAPPKPKRRVVTRRPYTDPEAALILNAARKERGVLRWLPWVCALTGARLNEIVQSDREDLIEVDGVLALRIHDDGGEDGETRSLKNADSRRTVPLHWALIAEGFPDYARALPAGSPLFPDVKPDAVFGLRSPIAGKKVSRWLKVKLGLSDPHISPSHSWRHTFIDAARLAEIPQEVRSAITGHTAKLDESAAYGLGVGHFIGLLKREIDKIALPKGVEPRAARPG